MCSFHIFVEFLWQFVVERCFFLGWYWWTRLFPHYMCVGQMRPHRTQQNNQNEMKWNERNEWRALNSLVSMVIVVKQVSCGRIFVLTWFFFLCLSHFLFHLLCIPFHMADTHTHTQISSRKNIRNEATAPVRFHQRNGYFLKSPGLKRKKGTKQRNERIHLKRLPYKNKT